MEKENNKEIHIWFNEDYKFTNYKHSRILDPSLDFVYDSIYKSLKYREKVHTIIPSFCSRKYYNKGFKILVHLFTGKVVEIEPLMVEYAKRDFNIEEELSWEEMLLKGYFGPVCRDQIEITWTKGESPGEEKYYSALKNDDLEEFLSFDYIAADTLHTCSFYNAINIAEYLIDNTSIDIDYRRSGVAINTPFTEACNNYHIEMMELLKDKGADIHLSHYISISEKHERAREVINFLDENNVDYELIYPPLESCGNC